MVENRGRKPNSPKVGGSVKNSVHTQTYAVKESILRVFNALNESDDYLESLAKEDRKLFVSLLARMVPTEQALTIDHTVKLDLGAAMREAEARVVNYDPEKIDHSPVPTALAPTSQAQAQRVYGKPNEQPMPDPATNPLFYEGIPCQSNNKELYPEYADEPHYERNKATGQLEEVPAPVALRTTQRRTRMKK